MNLKVLQLCKYYPPILGGIELVAKTITRAHVDLNDEVHIVAFGNVPGTATGEFSEDIILIEQDLFLNSAPISFSFLFKFKELVLKKEINRVYVHLPNPYMHEVLRQSKYFLRINKIEVVAVYHSDIVNQKFLGRLYDFYFSLTLSIYDYWICSSHKLWNSSPILKNINLSQKKIIPFCTDDNLTFRKREKFQGKLLAVGRLVPYKGFEFLIKAINKTNYQLHIIGDGPDFKKLEKLSGDNIVLHRRINDAEKKILFDQCDLLIVSSINRAEAYGMIIVEAFEAGLPVVASNLESGVSFLVQHEKTGLLFETKNEEKLIQAIKRLEKDDELYSQISLNSRIFFDSELRYEHFKNKIENL